jgi:RNA polymerase sigma-70 factor (ECF subfamily)
VLRLNGGVEEDARDVVQETWLRAVRELTGFRWRSRLSTWLAGIAVNCHRDRMRKRKVEVELPPDVVHHAPAVATAVLDRIELERALARMPPGYREVLILHDVEGFTHEEIGAMLGVAQGTSKSQLFHARRVLRALLAERLPPREAPAREGVR